MLHGACPQDGPASASLDAGSDMASFASSKHVIVENLAIYCLCLAARDLLVGPRHWTGAPWGAAGRARGCGGWGAGAFRGGRRAKFTRLLAVAHACLLDFACDDVRVIVTPLLLPVVVRHVGVSVSCHAAGTCSGPRGSGLPDR